MRMIFVNLPVKDVARSKAFFTGLGFGFNPDFSNDETLCMIVEENIFVMLMHEARFKEFIIDEISDTSKSTEVLTALSASSRQEVDDTLAKARTEGVRQVVTVPVSARVGAVKAVVFNHADRRAGAGVAQVK